MWEISVRALTAAGARALTKPGRYTAAPTLYLTVWKTGSKSWVQRVTINGQRRDIGLGPYPVVSIQEARRRALENRILIERGGDPLVNKRKSAAPTFREAANTVYKANLKRWKAGRHADR